MRITCPQCGERALEEFSYRGDATKRRPDSTPPDELEPWIDYVYTRDNPKGWHREHWHHSGGCRAWLVVERHTVTHEIGAVVLASEAPVGEGGDG